MGGATMRFTPVGTKKYNLHDNRTGLEHFGQFRQRQTRGVTDVFQQRTVFGIDNAIALFLMPVTLQGVWGGRGGEEMETLSCTH